MSTLVSLDNVHKTYGSADAPLHVLRGVTLSVEAGESLAIVGPSGSGKSTLLHLMGALDTPSEGTIQIAGQKLSSLNDKSLAALRNKTIGFVFQNHYLLPQLTVLENVLVPLLAGGSPGADDLERAAALLNEVGLSDRTSHRPTQLSGGECQRVAVVRALINSPKLLLADEPTGALDSGNATTLTDLLFRLHKDHELTLVLVTHAPDLAQRAHRRLRMLDGHLKGMS